MNIIAVDVHDLGVTAGHRGVKQPVEAGWPGGHSAQSDLSQSVIAPTTAGAVRQRPRSEAKETAVNRVSSEYAGLVASWAGAVAHFVLQCSVENSVIWGYRAGESN